MKKIILYIIVGLMFASVIYAQNYTVDNCSALPTDIVIDIDSQPYIGVQNDFLATLPSAYKTQMVRCWTYVKKDGQLQQTNPQKTEYSKTFFSRPKRQEDREYFTAQNGMVNVYFTQKNLVAYTTFVLGVRCVSETTGDMIVGETCITPYYKSLEGGVTARSVWAVENADMLMVLTVVVIIILILLGVFWRSLKR